MGLQFDTLTSIILIVIIIGSYLLNRVNQRDISYIDDEEIERISYFCQSAEKDFYCLVGPRNVSVDFKYDVLCL